MPSLHNRETGLAEVAAVGATVPFPEALVPRTLRAVPCGIRSRLVLYSLYSAFGVEGRTHVFSAAEDDG